MHTFSTGILCLLAVTVPFVAGHGYVASVSIDGKMYYGNPPGRNIVQSPIRTVNTVVPVQGTSNPELSCGQGTEGAPVVANADPGSTVSFKWVSGTGGNWPHNVGPVMTYMAACGPSGCAKFDSSSAKWFKIQESGLRSDGTWAMIDLYHGLPANVALPSNIAPGEYLVRHELLALQNAESVGGAEFYPSCVQLKVGGAQSGKPHSTVSFPGAYSNTDPGILVNVYPLTGLYQFPGPAVSNLAGKTLAARAVLAVNDTAAIDSPSGRLSRVMSTL